MSKRGLYQKYVVFKTGSTKRVEGFCFVLRPESDPAAFDALLRYIELTPDQQLATDLDRKLREIADRAAAIKNLESFKLGPMSNKGPALEILEMLIANFGSRTVIDAIHGLGDRRENEE